MDDASVDSDTEIVDFKRGLTPLQKEKILAVDTVPSDLIDSARKVFQNPSQITNGEVLDSETVPGPCTVYEHRDFDGQSLAIF
jgi:hypothetical protein